MEGLFWGCLLLGVLYALVSVLLGDVVSEALNGALDFLSFDGYPWIEPTTLVGSIAVFGGAGLLLSEYTGFGTAAIIVAALVTGVAAGACIYFWYVKPIKRSENSTAYSLQDFTGALAEVVTSIPALGYGEVLVKAGAGITNQIAASFDGSAIPGGSKVVVVEVKDNTLRVALMEQL